MLTIHVEAFPDVTAVLLPWISDCSFFDCESRTFEHHTNQRMI